VLSARLLVDSQDRLGECPLWCERTQALWWTDIDRATLHRWQAADGAQRQWTLPDSVGSFAFCDDGAQLLLGLPSGVALFDPDTGTPSTIVPLPPGQPDARGLRINDGRCDRQGRFVFGLFNTHEEPIGRFYRVHPGLRIERLPLPPVAVANSIAFSPDGVTMYFADSPARTIWRVAYRTDGSLGEPMPFVRLGEHEGYPDGSTVDADGGLWNAQWQGHCVVRYNAAGQETARLAVPASRPTCPAFGGPALDQLFITSSRAGLKPEDLLHEPGAGGVFRLVPGVRGLPEARFRLTA
jgi:L-arabinonolactonase